MIFCTKPATRHQPTAIDLFCGCGGLTLGLQWAGYDVLAGVEKDPLAAKAYRLNHKEPTLIEKDIRNVDPYELRQELGLQSGELSLLAACPPCQGFSSMRTLNGQRAVEDDRNSLVQEVSRFATAFSPENILMENVPGLAARAEFDSLKSQLTELGYRVASRVLNAKNYGVPQSRRRLIMLASRAGDPMFPEPWPSLVTVAETIRRQFAEEDPLHNYKQVRSQRIQALIEKIPKDGGSRTSLPESEQLPCHQKTRGFRDVYGRLAWDRPSNTVTGGCINPSKGRFLHPEEDRAITLREAALLQSFPLDYDFPLDNGYYAVATMIGNALPPRFIEAQAACLLRIEDER